MLQVRPFAVLWVIVFASIAGRASAHGVAEERGFVVRAPFAEIAGTWTGPAPHAAVDDNRLGTCAVIVGGTLSQTRDGGLLREGSPPRDALKRLARVLSASGYASLRYDRVGFGDSGPGADWTGSYTDEARACAAVMDYARGLEGVRRVVVIGESAGAYVACLAAKDGTQADAYVFLGGHCGDGPAIYEYNHARLLRLAEGDEDWRAFAESGHKMELALGKDYRQMFEAAARGERTYTLTYGDFSAAVGLDRRREELDMPPDRMFGQLTAPVLALAGEYDLNVPPDHAVRIVQVLREAGNHRATCVMIPGCDHSFQLSPEDEQQRLRERYSHACFENAYADSMYDALLDWLDHTAGVNAAASPGAVKETADSPGPDGDGLVQRTATTPRRILPAPGIQIIDDITDKQQTVGVGTLEGEIGPLLLGVGSQAHFIDMPAGMFCGEHPHSNESIIYTVRGRWVLCSNGRRHLMGPGSLFHFAPGTPTGYEVPFDEDAYILIFKGDRTTEKESDFIDYLKGMADRLKNEHAAGVPYLLTDLPSDHPAIEFARTVNPAFGR